MDWESSQSSSSSFLGQGNFSSGGGGNVNVNLNTSSTPWMEIVAQPQTKFRFRYKSEMTGKHGSLLGVPGNTQDAVTTDATTVDGQREDPQDFFCPQHGQSINPNANVNLPKLFPTVKLHNYPSDAIIRCSLVCENNPHYPHPHLLEMGQSTVGTGITNINEPEGISPADANCFIDIPISAGNDHTAVFQGLNIIFVSKKDIRRQLQYKMSQLDESSLRKVTPDKLDELVLNMNLNVVALYFEALFRDPDDPGQMHFISSPVVSTPIHHNKSTQTGELRIVRIDKFSSYCTGNEEVFILVEKVDKHNIQVKFYEESDKGVEIWRSYGQFNKLDVHHQYAIVFKTPAYRSLEIESEVDVWIQLERPTDGATSQPIRFQYRPVERIRKMPKRQPRSRGGDDDSTHDNPGDNSYEGTSYGGSDSSRSANPSGIEHGNPLAGPSNIRQGAIESQVSFACSNSNMASTEETTSQSKSLAMSVALSICQGLHGWAETSDFSLVLQKLRHLLCLVNENGDNALHSAIIHQQKEPFLRIVETLSSFPDTVGVLNEPNVQSMTPIHLAVLSNRMDFVGELLRHNVDISFQNSEGDTPLHIACKANDVTCVKYLLQSPTASAAINKFNYSSLSPLQIAVGSGFTELVELLCLNKASLTAQEGTYGKSALHVAVEKETKESIMSTMIILKAASNEKDLDLTNIQNYRGDTPLHCAANSGFTTLCALLMHYGGDPGVENHVRRTPETDDDDNDVEQPQPAPAAAVEADNDGEERLSGHTVYDVAASDQVLRIIKGTEDDWEIILKACSPLLVSSSAAGEICSSKDSGGDSKYLDSGIDVNNFNSSQFLNSSSCNQL